VYLKMAANGGRAKASDVFAAVKSMHKNEKPESHARSKVQPIIAVVPPSKEVSDRPFVSNAGSDYVNDTLQVWDIVFQYLKCVSCDIFRF